MELNKIYNEDCLEGMKRIPDKSVDMILCDLPYGVTACKWDSVIPFEPLWEQYNRIIKDNGAVVLFGSEPFSSNLRMSNIENFKYKWTWIKNQATNHLHAKRMPMRKTEDINVFFKNSSWYNPQKTYGHIPTSSAKGCSNGVIYHGKNIRDYKGGDTSRMPIDVLEFNCVNNYAKVHPNEKPVDLFEYLIKTYTNEGETVLDNCMGSGTTAIACINTNRNYIGFELDKGYYDIANERIEKRVSELKEVETDSVVIATCSEV